MQDIFFRNMGPVRLKRISWECACGLVAVACKLIGYENAHVVGSFQLVISAYSPPFFYNFLFIFRFFLKTLSLLTPSLSTSAYSKYLEFTRRESEKELCITKFDNSFIFIYFFYPLHFSRYQPFNFSRSSSAT